jgi:flap endonuclease-1
MFSISRSNRLFFAVVVGIKGLTKLLQEEAPDCIREHALENYTGRKVALDASMCIYQFMFAIRQTGENGVAGQLTNDEGETTSHIQGIFNRTIRLLTAGIKPLYVFDGKPPTLKGGELAKRRDARAKAEADLKEAKEAGNVEDMNKYSGRLVKVLPQHNQECQQLLTLMGVPWIVAPCEAEAQCAQLVKDGHCYAAGTEDMDTLTFATPVLLRRLTAPASQKQPIMEITLDKVLSGLGLNYEQFVDLCILCGCDYSDSIKGVGPKTALKQIKRFKTIEAVIKNTDTKKHTLPADWVPKEEGQEPLFDQARKMFVEHEVTKGDDVKIKWEDCKEEELTKFLVEKFGFSHDRVKNAIVKLKKSKNLGSQKRMDSFFKPKSAPDASNNADKKRKLASDKKKALAKNKKSKGKGGFAKRR